MNLLEQTTGNVYYQSRLPRSLDYQGVKLVTRAMLDVNIGESQYTSTDTTELGI